MIFSYKLLWGKFTGKIYRENLWGKFTGKIYGKIYGENLIYAEKYK
jgi:hypothetical protein